MRKSVVILALALGFSTVSVNATNLCSITDGIENEVIESKPSALCTAVVKGDVVAIKALIKNGADVNQKSNGMLPIHYAAKYNRVDVIKVLITSGSKIHSTCDKGFTALQHASKTKALDAAKFLKRFKGKDA